MAADLSSEVRLALVPYLATMREYLEGRLADVDFEAAFNPRYLAEPAKWPYDVFNQLDAVFAVAEEFEPDPVVRAEAPDATDQAEMHRIISAAYAKLVALVSHS